MRARRQPEPQRIVSEKRGLRTEPARFVTADGREFEAGFFRLVPVVYKPKELERPAWYWDSKRDAESFLHDLICTVDDYAAIPFILAGRGTWGGKRTGGARPPHGPDDCEGPSWHFVEKQRGSLLWGFAYAARLRPVIKVRVLPKGMLRLHELPESGRLRRPLIKSGFYDLAAAYALKVEIAQGRIPRGVYRELARHLEAPWFGIELTAAAVKVEVASVRDALLTCNGVWRYPTAATVQWGDDIVAACHVLQRPPAEVWRIRESYLRART